MLPKHWKDTSQLASVCETFDMTENVRDVQLLTVNYQLPLALHWQHPSKVNHEGTFQHFSQSAMVVHIRSMKWGTADAVMRGTIKYSLHTQLKWWAILFHFYSCVPQRGWAAPRGGCNTGATREGDKASFVQPSWWKNLETTYFPQRKRNSCYTVKNSYFYLILAKRPWSDDQWSSDLPNKFWPKWKLVVAQHKYICTTPYT